MTWISGIDSAQQFGGAPGVVVACHKQQAVIPIVHADTYSIRPAIRFAWSPSHGSVAGKWRSDTLAAGILYRVSDSCPSNVAARLPARKGRIRLSATGRLS